MPIWFPPIPPVPAGRAQPYDGPSKLTPRLEDVDYRTSLGREWLSIVLRAWQPPDPPPTLPRRFIPGQEISNPPGRPYDVLPIVEAWQISYLLPELPEQVAATIPIVTVTGQVPFSQLWLYTVLKSWEPSLQLPTLNELLPQQTSNDPTPLDRRWLAGVLKTWEIVPPAQVFLPKQTVSVDNPTHQDIRWLSAVLTAWLPGPPSQVLYPSQRQSIDKPIPLDRRWLDGVLQTWQPVTPARILMPTQRVSVDLPPPMDRRWLMNVVRAWQAGDSSPQFRTLVAALLFQAAQVDNPPPFVSQLYSILRQWQPGDPIRVMDMLRQQTPPTGPVVTSPFDYQMWRRSEMR